MARKRQPKPEPAAPTPAEGEVGADNPATVRGDLADLKLVRRALDQGWDVPEKIKKLGVLRMGQILSRGKSRSRAWTAAARTLVSMTTATTAAIGTAIQARTHEEQDRRLEDLEAWKATQEAAGASQGDPGPGTGQPTGGPS